MTTDSASLAPLEAIVSLAKKAGLAIMALYNEGNLDVRFKEDVSPVTRADLAAHRVILAGLQKLTPMFPVRTRRAMLAACSGSGPQTVPDSP